MLFFCKKLKKGGGLIHHHVVAAVQNMDLLQVLCFPSNIDTQAREMCDQVGEQMPGINKDIVCENAFLPLDAGKSHKPLLKQPCPECPVVMDTLKVQDISLGLLGS